MRNLKHILIGTLLVATLVAATPAVAQSRNDGLVLRGKQRSVRIERDGKDYVNVILDLDLEFFNPAATSIIVLQPQEGHPAETYWLGSVSLSLARFLAARNDCTSAIWDLATYPSVSTAPEFAAMAKKLDQPAPPADLTRVLRPNETWTWQTNAFLRFYAHTPASVYSHSDLDWDIVRQIQTPLWMRLNYVVWSLNLQRADTGLRKRLQRRWKNVGLLNIAPDLTSEPIEVRLNAN